MKKLASLLWWLEAIILLPLSLIIAGFSPLAANAGAGRSGIYFYLVFAFIIACLSLPASFLFSLFTKAKVDLSRQQALLVLLVPYLHIGLIVVLSFLIDRFS